MRTIREPSGTLREALDALVGQYGKTAVLAAVEALTRPRRSGQATRDDMERITALVNRLLPYPKTVFNHHAFLQKQLAAEIPTKVTIEILERLVAVRPREPWAFIEHIMATDYPGHNWGRGPQGRMSRVEG